ncbi:MAG TPA: PfkB family carbohydrate kinase [Casimicrobiaceae bacterium]
MSALVDRITQKVAAAQSRRVVCVGLSAFDMTWMVEVLPAGSGKQRASAFHDGGGGMAANAAVTVRRLGAEAHFWGRAGDDVAGRAMRAELGAEGVDVSGFRLFAGARSSVSGILVDQHGERSIVNFRGEALPADARWLPLERIDEAAAVLADPRWPEGAAAAFAAARGARVPTILDGDVADAATLDALLPWVDFAIFSEPGLQGYAGTTRDIEALLRQALERGTRLAAVTVGARGVCWLEEGELWRLPAFATEVVDTTGTGDAFHGAAALALGAGLAVNEAFIFASAVAALKCGHRGARAGLPGLAAVAAFLHDAMG